MERRIKFKASAEDNAPGYSLNHNNRNKYDTDFVYTSLAVRNDQIDENGIEKRSSASTDRNLHVKQRKKVSQQ